MKNDPFILNFLNTFQTEKKKKMGAFTSEDTAAYCARYAAHKKESGGYKSIRTGNQSLHTFNSNFQRSFAGTWKIRPFEGQTPAPRMGHCTVVSKELDKIFICYGISPTNNEIFSDVWALDLKTNQWEQLNIDTQITPRFGARACLIKDEIWIFGGSDDTNFLGDLHCINIITGAVSRPETTGRGPTPRIHHIMEYSNNKLLVYSGADTTLLTDLYLLDLETMEWDAINVDYGRSQAAYSVIDSHLYVYGATQTPGFLVFDFSLHNAQSISTSGVVPPSTLTDAVLVPVDNYLLLVGGDNRNDVEDAIHFAPIYIYNIESSQWSILPIQTDNVTTNQSDGHFDKNGNFLCPLCRQSSIAYDENARELVVFLGSPPTIPPTSHIITLAKPLAYQHLQDDMLAMFRKTFI